MNYQRHSFINPYFTSLAFIIFYLFITNSGIKYFCIRLKVI